MKTYQKLLSLLRVVGSCSVFIIGGFASGNIMKDSKLLFNINEAVVGEICINNDSNDDFIVFEKSVNSKDKYTLPKEAWMNTMSTKTNFTEFIKRMSNISYLEVNTNEKVYISVELKPPDYMTVNRSDWIYYNTS